MSKTGQPVEIDRRLMAAAGFVRQGAVFADIGTDHAYLPVYLLQKKIIDFAIAADINQGPLDRARLNVEAAGLSDKVGMYRCDGLSGLDGQGITDIAICGMGGELIAKIISDAEWARVRGMRFILQPMTKSEILRKYLITHGFSPIEEALAKTDRIYQIICAEYTGVNQVYSEAELLLGRYNIARKDSLSLELAENITAAMLKRREAKTKAGRSADYEEQIIAELIKSGLTTA